MIPFLSLQRGILLLGDFLLIVAATQLAPWIRLGHFLPIFQLHTGASTFTILLYLSMLYIFDMYNMGRQFRLRDNVLRLGVALTAGGILSAFLFYSFPHWKYGRGIFLIQFLLAWVFLSGWRQICIAVFPRTMQKENALILGAGKRGITLYRLLKGAVSPFLVKGFLDDDPAKQGITVGSPKVLGTIEQLPQIARQQNAKTAMIALRQEQCHKHMSCLMELRFKGLNILDMPAVCEKLTGRVPVRHIGDEWLALTSGFYLLSKEYLQKIKRLADFAISTLLLLCALPISIVTALVIKVDSPGPIFFKQDRVGKNGQIFTIWKFRSMHQNAEALGAVWAEKNDCRVTRVGKIIRFLRIDEIPQLYNVFRGEMSLIGPRPERPEFVKELEILVPYYGLRHSVRPGITGWSQVNYPYGASVEDAICKLEYDLYYIKNMSLVLEFKIILKTIGVVLFGQGSR